VKYGHANGKQVLKCRDCGKKFREGLIKKTRYTPETITLTLDLYFSGLSLRKITRTLGDHFGLENLGKSTVYRWIETFVPKISAYVNNLNPQLSPDWHADELFVKMKGGARTPNNPKESIAYLWNVMDRKTRFLLASKLSRFRDISGADRALIEAYHNAKGSKPERIYTDALKSYQMAIACWPEDQRPIHIAKSGLRKPVATNNRIEALNGTLRERVKVQRGWKSYKTPLAEGMRIHYNFVKPHSSLEGQTPADNAGVGIAKGDKWMALLKEAIKG
jgi:transposase-like protein